MNCEICKTRIQVIENGLAITKGHYTLLFKGAVVCTECWQKQKGSVNAIIADIDAVRMQEVHLGHA